LTFLFILFGLLWFSPGTAAFSTTKTGRHDIAEISLKVALSTINQINQSNHLLCKNNSHLVHNISDRTTGYGQATGKLYHLWLRVKCTLFCNLQSRANDLY
jgi:hypothetical protein